MIQLRHNLLILSLAIAVPLACSAGSPNQNGDGDGDETGDGDGDGDIDIPGDGDGDITTQPPTLNCGDGVLDSDEACDDGNLEGGDGCGGNCRFIEPGFVCPDPGEPCRAFAKCGDGILVFPEQCDDGNLTPDDGCSATCKVEIGSKCDGSPSVCTATTCGDGMLEGAETCDEGDIVPFDGCSPTCQAEPSCTDEGCTSSCGDGLVIGNEECDDGNSIDGDGCSSSCTIEPGYECGPAENCEMIGEECVLRLPIIYRDFNVGGDFQPPFQQGDVDGHSPGVVQALLNEQGKPVWASSPANSHIASATSFGEWYTTSANNSQIVGDIVLFDNGAGGFVNRYGENGEQYPGVVTGSGTWCGNLNQHASCEAAAAAGQCNDVPVPGENNSIPYDPAVHTCWEVVGNTKPPGAPDNCCNDCWCAGTSNQNFYDGNPVFFPIDNHPDALTPTNAYYPAKIPAEIYEANGWPWEPPADVSDQGVPGPTQPLHNFHFTSEIAYWFEYQEGMTANLTFIGDDDVWVFVNRRLVIDLGGIHVPLIGNMNLLANGDVTVVQTEPSDQPNDAGTDLPMPDTTVDALGLEPGGVYEVKVFHAERKPDGSSFQLTLSGFDASRSECGGICGDGILVAGEECDDGEENNVGGHNRCNADCTLGGYCGDGIVQMPEEECDDNDPAKPADCSGCRILVVR